MKIQCSVALAASAMSLVVTSRSYASYQGLVTISSSVVVGGQLRNVYRVYASFSDPDDYMLAVSGTPTLGNLTIRTVNFAGVPAGDTFFNAPLAGITAPTAELIAQSPDAQYDTFVTIGVSVADLGSGPPEAPDQTAISPFFAGIGSVAAFTTNNGGWYTPGPVPQGRAGYVGDGDPILRVLLMQLTVSSTSGVQGTFALSGINNTSLAGGQQFTVSGQTWAQTPAPGALMTLGIAGLMVARRRRRQC